MRLIIGSKKLDGLMGDFRGSALADGAGVGGHRPFL